MTDMGDEIGARFLVSGRVQGVFFRASTQAQAQMLGLRGYARNLENGQVEVVAAGDTQALERLHAWLAEGPPQARVDRVEREAASADGLNQTFEVRR